MACPKMKTEQYLCDLCENPIENYNPDGSKMTWGDNQIWPVDNGEIDVCVNCCLILDKAMRFDIISIDFDKLYEYHGFRKTPGGLYKSG